MKLLDLPRGISKKDVFRRVLVTLKPDAFQACFTMWDSSAAQQLRRRRAWSDRLWPSTERRRGEVMIDVAILGALHSVTVWASEFGLRSQVATAEKSNEITAIRTPLSLVDIHGAIFTIDAMGTQTAIAEKIIDDGGDYVLALKGNQGTLHDAVIDYINEQTKADFRGIDARRLDTSEKKHGRIESRT